MWRAVVMRPGGARAGSVAACGVPTRQCCHRGTTCVDRSCCPTARGTECRRRRDVSVGGGGVGVSSVVAHSRSRGDDRVRGK